MNACEATRKQLSAYLDGEISLPEKLFVDSHLTSCEACRARKGELERADRHLTSAPEPAWAANSTDFLVSRLKAQLAKETKPAPPVHALAAIHGWLSRIPVAALAAVCGFVVLPALFLTSISMTSGSRMQSASKAPAVALRKGADQEVALRRTSDETGAGAGGAGAAPAAAAPPAEARAGKADLQLAAARPAPKPMLKAEAAHPAAPVSSADVAFASTSSSVSASPAPALAPLAAQVEAVEARLARLQSDVASFTVAARQEATQRSTQVASRRWAAWR